MGFLKMLAGGVSRDAQIKKLKAQFAQQYPGESTQGTFEGYCGMGMKVAESINAGNETERLHFMNINHWRQHATPVHYPGDGHRCRRHDDRHLLCALGRPFRGR
ncbi:hypothetical protein V4C53_45505 [Paraburkholderia azotifigens]|uniref:hypothetical protein n=1 Tax=Paraburkholderia azotifigens TaxID=2057004 RepID=UPI0004BBDB5E